jgi:hypothetical protein
MNVLATIGQWCTERSLESKHGSTSRSISSSSYRLESTPKRTGGVDFLMKVLATMGQLCTERSLESKNWSKFWVFTKGDEASSSDYVGRVKAVIFWQVKINCFLGNLYFWPGLATTWSTSNDRSKFKVKLKFIVETWKYSQRNRKSRLSSESISNYGSIMYWKVAREQKLVKILRFYKGCWSQF